MYSIITFLLCFSWEPKIALDGGSDGLDFYNSLANCIFNSKKRKVILLEIGYDQAEQVVHIFSKANSSEVIKDLGNRDRVCIFHKE